eukprot:CAMPEP_0118906746 /NCGR_PEP_ID=MMETSP1166-20130328/10452_1 /TAXON_ID=1104430 /ORGANISM="Chrysoreinhardia sp, Strain CCMP3193" /LENGTH=590 /DNA_ID=CAMNT_0006846087 /DNA_START=107 /DNA_END=1879 /DNA_ORIENTATION=+
MSHSQLYSTTIATRNENHRPAPRWMPDAESSRCFGCQVEFDAVVTRRHHCRRCGLLYCEACSSYRSLIHPANVVYPPDWDSALSSFDPREPLRVCRGCYEQLAPEQDELLKTTANAAQPTEVERDSYERYANVPIQFEMRSEIHKATNTLYNFCSDNALEGSDSVPSELIASAWGLAFVTTMQAGFFFSGRVGSGLVIARTPDGGWSAPSAVCTAGAGWGLQIGGEVTDMLIVLNSQDAVEAFSSTAQLSLGTELSLALGPMGRSAETNMTAGDGGVSAVFSYAHSKGFFVGIALHACVILARPDCNERFYGKRYDVGHVLSGGVQRPIAAEPLYKALDEVIAQTENAEGNNPYYRKLVAEELASSSSSQQVVPNVVEVRVRDADPTSTFRDDGFGGPNDDDPKNAPPVKAAPVTPYEQHVMQMQIDADMALALAISEEEKQQHVQTTGPPPPPPLGPKQQVLPRVPPRQQAYPPAAAANNNNSAATTTWSSATNDYDTTASSSWTSFFGPSQPPPPPPTDDDEWERERQRRLQAAVEDPALTYGAEELKPMMLRGPSRNDYADGPDFDTDDHPPPPPGGAYKPEEEVTL